MKSQFLVLTVAYGLCGSAILAVAVVASVSNGSPSASVATDGAIEKSSAPRCGVEVARFDEVIYSTIPSSNNGMQDIPQGVFLVSGTDLKAGLVGGTPVSGHQFSQFNTFVITEQNAGVGFTVLNAAQDQGIVTCTTSSRLPCWQGFASKCVGSTDSSTAQKNQVFFITNSGETSPATGICSVGGSDLNIIATCSHGTGLFSTGDNQSTVTLTGVPSTQKGASITGIIFGDAQIQTSRTFASSILDSVGNP